MKKNQQQVNVAFNVQYVVKWPVDAKQSEMSIWITVRAVIACTAHGLNHQRCDSLLKSLWFCWRAFFAHLHRTYRLTEHVFITQNHLIWVQMEFFKVDFFYDFQMKIEQNLNCGSLMFASIIFVYWKSENLATKIQKNSRELNPRSEMINGSYEKKIHSSIFSKINWRFYFLF